MSLIRVFLLCIILISCSEKKQDLKTFDTVDFKDLNNYISDSLSVTIDLDLNEVATITDYDSASDHIVVVNGGSNAKTLVASVDSQVFAFDDSTDTDSDPSSIEFSFQQQNLSGTIAASDITITRNGGSVVTGFDFDNNDVSNGTGIVSGS